jgi:hypothetical protein
MYYKMSTELRDLDKSLENVFNETINENSDSDSDAETNNIKIKDTEPEVTPMSDADVNNIRKRLAMLDEKELNYIIDTYSQVIKGVLTIAMKNTKDEDEIVELERLKRLINLAPKDELFIRSKDKVWAARKRVINRDINWFLNRDYSKLIKRDSKQVMIETLINIAKNSYLKLDSAEQEIYWQKGFKLLQIVAQYKKISGEK